uniref:Cullin domain-containing protein n=1 Tax=Caenorhabditis japonica TaxID=281687 RepID=A0A8R1HVQ5_CAEJA
MTSGANQTNSVEKSRSKQLRKSSKRPGNSMDGTQAKQARQDHSDEEMEEEASGSCREMVENNLVSNFNLQHKENARAATAGNERVKKKLVIKNFKLRNNTNCENGIEQNNIDNPSSAVGRDWAVLSDNVHAILEDRKTITTMETLFSKVRSVCDKDQSKPLYDHLVKIVVDFAKLLKESLTSEESIVLMEDTCEQYLAKFGSIWEAYPVKINLIRNIFLYLDRMSLSGGDTEMLPLWEISMQLYQKTFFPEISNDFKSIKLFSALYMAMNRMMSKYTVDSPLKSLIDMLQTVHTGEEFANFLLNQLREQYNKERVEKVPRMSAHNIGKQSMKIK